MAPGKTDVSADCEMQGAQGEIRCFGNTVQIVEERRDISDQMLARTERSLKNYRVLIRRVHISKGITRL